MKIHKLFKPNLHGLVFTLPALASSLQMQLIFIIPLGSAGSFWYKETNVSFYSRIQIKFLSFSLLAISNKMQSWGNLTNGVQMRLTFILECDGKPGGKRYKPWYWEWNNLGSSLLLLPHSYCGATSFISSVSSFVKRGHYNKWLLESLPAVKISVLKDRSAWLAKWATTVS